MYPVVAVAESTPAKLRQQDGIGCAAARIQDAGQHRRFVCRIENQSREPLPIPPQLVARQCGDSRDCGPLTEDTISQGNGAQWKNAGSYRLHAH
jgi:hypothetical protein